MTDAGGTPGLAAERTHLPGVLVLRPRVHGDDRGYFLETYNARTFHQATGCDEQFVQDNQSRSARGVLRGLHYQVGADAQGKLVRVLAGRIFDVAVDLRRSSATFAHWTGRYLDGTTHEQMWIPAGFAHGFLVVSDHAEVAYKTTTFYAPEAERAIRFDDPLIGIRWPLDGEPSLSRRDANAPGLDTAETFS